MTLSSGSEINKASYELHVAYCLKNIVKCPYCVKKINLKAIDTHIEEEKGTP